jgi:MtaA/CmuA family methyltransferase
MNGYERFQSVFQGRQPDFAPRMPILMDFKARYLGVAYDRFAAEPSVKAEANIRCATDFGYDQVDVMSDPYTETHDFGAKIEFVKDGVPRCHHPPLADTMVLARLKKPDPHSPGRMQNTVETIRLYRQRVFKQLSIQGWVEGPAAEAGDLRGIEQFLLDLYEEPDFCLELMELCTTNAIRFARAQVEAGADVIGVGDAICSQISPKLHAEMIAPQQRRLFDAVHAAGAAVRLHICGNVTHILPALAGLPFDLLDVDSLTDLSAARAALGPKCVLAGNLNPVADMMNGTPESIRLKVRECAQKAGAPWVASAGCEIPAATSHANLRALCEPILP